MLSKRMEAEDWWVSEPLFSQRAWSPYMISWVAHALAFVLYFIKLQLWYQLRLGTSCWYTELLVISRLVQMLGVKKSIRSTSYSWNRLHWGYLDCSIQTATCSHPLSMNAYLVFFSVFVIFMITRYTKYTLYICTEVWCLEGPVRDHSLDTSAWTGRLLQWAKDNVWLADQ